MRSAVTVLALVPMLTSAQSQSEKPSLQPTALEAVAMQGNAKLTWAWEIARIESSDARAILTAVEYEYPSSPGSKFRGVRVELSNTAAADTVFIERDRLRVAASALSRLAASVPRYN